MTAAPRTIRRTVSLLSVTASLALPGAALAMPAPETGYHESPASLASVDPAPSSVGGNDTTLPIALASGALAIALGGAAYSVRLGSAQRRVLKVR